MRVERSHRTPATITSKSRSNHCQTGWEASWPFRFESFNDDPHETTITIRFATQPDLHTQPPICRFSHQVLGLIAGRDRSTISPYIRHWARKWGEAGEDLSILEITAEFLDATCPESYKRQGLTKICAVPDGKDFSIETPRTHTLLTRSAWSDKIHHSAVRIISWSTPTALSFEHTDGYLARATEPTLVELWSPRLKKCPPGYDMLSDRGFAKTARLYPNLNGQLTPHFLAGRPQFTAGSLLGQGGQGGDIIKGSLRTPNI